MAHASVLLGAAAHLMQSHPSCHEERVGGKTNRSYSARYNELESRRRWHYDYVLPQHGGDIRCSFSGW
jgi:hypothetical protein